MMRGTALGVVALCLTGCLTIPSAGAPEAPDLVEPGPAEPLWPGADIARLYEAGEVRTFVITQGGQQLGASWGRYVGPERLPDGSARHRFETRVELEVPGRGLLRTQGALVLDARGEIVSGWERTDQGEVRFTRDGEILRLEGGGGVDELLYEPQRTPTVAMAHSAILHEELMLGLLPLSEGEQERRLLSLSGGPPVDWKASAHRRGEELVVRTSLGETITLRDGRVREISVPSSDLRIVAESAPPWPAWSLDPVTGAQYTTAGKGTFDTWEVELPGQPGEPKLFGEVLIPQASRLPGAAVLYVSSTAQEDRHGLAGRPAVDLGSHELTDALADAGFVVLRFDERGYGRSEAGQSPVGFMDQVEDVRRAYRTLLVQDEVDPDRIILVGHGEGGWRALHVALGRQLAGVALLAVPGRPYREVFHHQSRGALLRLPPELRAEAIKQQQSMLDAIADGREPPPELAAQALWLREMMAQQPQRLIARIDVPLFLAQGGKDFEVDPQADLEALVKAAADPAKVEVRRYPDLDHRFKVEPGQSDPSRYRERGRPVDPVFLQDLVAWATRVAPPG